MELQDYITVWGIPEEEDPYLEEPETEQDYLLEEGEQS
jgi:hypothetical protein